MFSIKHIWQSRKCHIIHNWLFTRNLYESNVGWIALLVSCLYPYKSLGEFIRVLVQYQDAISASIDAINNVLQEYKLVQYPDSLTACNNAISSLRSSKSATKLVLLMQSSTSSLLQNVTSVNVRFYKED